MTEKKPDRIALGDIVRLDDKTKGIVVSIFTGYKQREMVDIMTYKDYPKIITAYLDDVKKTGEHLTEIVYVLRYLQREA